MLKPWNDLLILPPPVNMFLCLKKFDTSALKHVCNNIIKVLSKQSPLHRESALCSRFLYKYDRKFRNDIGYRNFKKVHTALKKYLSLNILKDIDSFLSALPSDNDDGTYLPTRQMLEYVLLRIISFSLIMLRICVCSKQAAIFYLNRVKRGESHWMSLLPYALLCRLWSMTMVLVQYSTTWYSNLYPYLNKLELKGLNFLPDNYSLPDDLEVWLDLKNVDCFGRFDWDQKKLIDVDNILLDDDESDLFDNILNIVNQSCKNDSMDELALEQQFKPIVEKIMDQVHPMKVDHGEVLSRDSFKKDYGEVVSRDCFKRDEGEPLSRESFKLMVNSPKKDTKQNAQSQPCDKNKSQIQKTDYKDQIVKENKKALVENKPHEHSHMNVTNTTSLREFIEREEMFRNKSDKKALTDHLSFMQWHALKTALLKLCDELTNRKIERKVQKIWQDKCLDYKR